MPTIPDGHEAPPTMDCTFVALTRTQGDNPVEILNEDELRIVAGGTESRRRYAEDPGRRSPRGPGRRGAGRHTTGAWRRAGGSASPGVPIRSGHRTARRRPTSCRVSGLGYRGLDKPSKALVSWRSTIWPRPPAIRAPSSRANSCRNPPPPDELSLAFESALAP